MPETIINNGVINLGRCCPKYRGNYSALATYRGLDYVLYTGKLWLAIHNDPFMGQEPRNGDYWREVAINVTVDSDLTSEQIALLKGPKGDQGPKGEQGEPFKIHKTYPSVTAMNADISVPTGSMVIIASKVDDPDNSKLYVKGEKGYVFLNDLSGAQGIQGPKGDKGAPGDTGPKGEQGVAGPQGPKGETGETGPQGQRGDPFKYSDFTQDQLTGLKGPKGDQGDRGPQGYKGDPGPKGENGETGPIGATGADGPRGPAGEGAAELKAFYDWLKGRNYDMDAGYSDLDKTYPLIEATPLTVIGKPTEGETFLPLAGQKHFKVGLNGTDYTIGSDGRLAITVPAMVKDTALTLTYKNYLGSVVETRNVVIAGSDGVVYCVPKSVTEITKNVVKQYNLCRAEPLIFPETVTCIGSFAFQNCSSLTSVSLPACTRVEEYCFSACSSLTSVSLPTCTRVEEYCFGECSSLTSVSLPTCSRIDAKVFDSCTALTSVNLPLCVYLDTNAFVSCTALTSVSLPACTHVGLNAFWGCVKLATLILSESCDFSNISTWSLHNIYTIYNPDKTKKYDRSAKKWVSV